MDIVSRLKDGELYIDAIDDAIAEIERLREKFNALGVAHLDMTKERNTLKDTIVSVVGGFDYEGLPTSRLNYLQRLRILVQKEIELAAMTKELDELSKGVGLE